MDNEFTYENSVAKIKVFGIGGAGNNAINCMVASNIKSAEFVALNTDKQSLMISQAIKKLQLGERLTKGLGAGANPKTGSAAAEESKDDIRKELEGVDLLFIAAGMGGGTGSGAAPVVAKIAREMNIMTIAVITTPFSFEGTPRMRNAMEGIENLRQYVDTLVIIPNDKLSEIVSEDTSIGDSFGYANDVLKKSIQSISDLITIPSLINLDFADVKTVMMEKGLAHMSIGEAEGPDKTMSAVRNAVMSPLLGTNIKGSTGVIINIVGGKSLTLAEVTKACNLVKDSVDPNANIIVGAGIDENMGDKVQVTLIATGFEESKMNNATNNTYEQHIEQMPITNNNIDQKFSYNDTIDTPNIIEDDVSPNSVAYLEDVPKRKPGFLRRR